MSNKGGRWCSVKNCHNDGKTSKRSFHKFPKSPVRCMKWMRLCRRDDLIEKGVEYAHKNCKVCSDHFHQSSFINSFQNRLHPNVVPTIFQWRCDDIGNPTNAENDDDSYANVVNNNNGDENGIENINDMTDNVSLHSNNNQTEESMSQNNDFPRSLSWNRSILKTTSTNTNTSTLSQSVKINTKKEIKEAFTQTPTSFIFSLTQTKEASTQTPKYFSSPLFSNKNKRKLERQLATREAKIIKLEEECHATRITKKSELDILLEMMKKHFSPGFAKLALTQVSLQSHHARGRRYDAEWKQFALHLNYLSPKSYTFLKSFLALPSIRCLQRFTQKWDCTPGLNVNILEGLRIRGTTMADLDRECTLCMDEMSLKSHLYYDISRDVIVGMPQFEDNKCLVAARSVFVLMARGIKSKWKQPLGFYFVNTSCQAENIDTILCETIDKLNEIQFNVRCIISDMGTNFQSFAQNKQITEHQPFFFHNGKKIFYLFDPPHLLKSLRNNLMKYNFVWEDTTVSWSDIQTYHSKDSQLSLRSAPKLTTAHISPTNFQKMKVKYAAQVFSRTVAAGIMTHAALGTMDDKANNTSMFLENVDHLFDVFNSSTWDCKGKISRLPFTGSDSQMDILEKMYDIFSKIIAVDPESGTRARYPIHTFRIWRQNINCIRELWSTLKTEGFQFLLTRRQNQDCLENLFGSIRKKGGNCLNPTPIQFIRAFKQLCALQFLQPNEDANCEIDFDAILNAIPEIAPTIDNNQAQPIVPLSALREINNDDYITMQLPEVNVMKYISGYIMGRCFKIHKCDVCSRYGRTNPAVDRTNFLSFFRAYTSTEANPFGSLVMPSEPFNLFIYGMEVIFTANFELFCTSNNVGKNILEAMNLLPFTPPCPNFPMDYLKKLYVRMRIYYTIKYWNEEIKNRRTARTHAAARHTGNTNASYFLRMRNLLGL